MIDTWFTVEDMRNGELLTNDDGQTLRFVSRNEADAYIQDLDDSSMYSVVRQNNF